MKKYLLLIITTILFASCSDDVVGPGDKTPFEPTGFILSSQDSIHIYYNNGELNRDKGDTLILDWYLGEKTFDIQMLNKDGVLLDNPDPLDYYTYAEVTNKSQIDDRKVFATAYNFNLSMTPHDEGTTDFLFRLTKSDGTLVLEAREIPIIINRASISTKK